MGKMVGIAEFKAKCERLISEMERDGEPIELTRRGKVVGVLRPPVNSMPDPDSLFGCLASPAYRFDCDPSAPAYDGLWDAEKGEWEPKD